MAHAAALPPTVKKILTWITPPAVLIAASTNFEALYNLGEAIHLGVLSFSMPLTVIGYEFASTALYFLVPKRFKGLRKSAAFGAVFGLAMTIGLAILWLAIDSGKMEADFFVRLVLKPIPSLVAGAFAHMLVLVWKHAETPATESMATPKPVEIPALPAGPTEEERIAEIQQQIDATMAPVLADFQKTLQNFQQTRPTRRTVRKPEVSTSKPVVPDVVAPVLPEPEAGNAEPEIGNEEPVAKPVSIASLPKVDEKHVRLAIELRNAEIAAGRDPDALKSGEVMKHFHGISDRQVRNALRVARHMPEADLAISA